jgi:transcriptional regulator with XRE-family HTH domain
MIKNASQLKSAQSRIDEIESQLKEYRKKDYSREVEFYIAPLETEKQELDEEIEEYLKLQSLPFEDAVRDVLNEPVLIDNIGQLLSKLRLAAKLTQAEMADQLGWEQSNLSRFESENYSSQTVNKIVEFVSELGVYLHVIPSLTEQYENRFFMTSNELTNLLIKSVYSSTQEAMSSVVKLIEPLDFDTQKVGFQQAFGNVTSKVHQGSYQAITNIFRHPLEDTIDEYPKTKSFADNLSST